VIRHRENRCPAEPYPPKRAVSTTGISSRSYQDLLNHPDLGADAAGLIARGLRGPKHAPAQRIPEAPTVTFQAAPQLSRRRDAHVK
jgi:hypothetical protein